MPNVRDGVFISYAHADKSFFDDLQIHLQPLVRRYKIKAWSDKELKPGELWLSRIRKEVRRARVGILLVSKHFLASEFIHSDELPPLLEGAKSEGVILYTLVIGYCQFSDSPLSKLQAFNDPKRPLSLIKPNRRDEVYADLVARLKKHFPEKIEKDGAVKAKSQGQPASPAGKAKPKLKPKAKPKQIVPTPKKSSRKSSENKTKSSVAPKAQATQPLNTKPVSTQSTQTGRRLKTPNRNSTPLPKSEPATVKESKKPIAKPKPSQTPKVVQGSPKQAKPLSKTTDQKLTAPKSKSAQAVKRTTKGRKKA